MFRLNKTTKHRAPQMFKHAQVTMKLHQNIFWAIANRRLLLKVTNFFLCCSCHLCWSQHSQTTVLQTTCRAKLTALAPSSPPQRPPQAKVMLKKALHGSHSACFFSLKKCTHILCRFIPTAAEPPAEKVDTVETALWSFFLPSTLEHPRVATAWCNEKRIIQESWVVKSTPLNHLLECQTLIPVYIP